MPKKELIGEPGEIAIRVEEVRAPADDRSKNALDLVPFILISIISLYAVLRLWHLGRYSLWYDEVFSVSAAQSSWKMLFTDVLKDKIHPPLFYIVLKIWIRLFGATIVRLRLLSVLFSLLAAPLFWKAMKMLGISDGLRLSLVLAVATNPFLILYSQEVRMYALLFLLAAASLLFYLRLWVQPRRGDWAFLAIINALMVATHFAGLAIVASECAHWCFHRPAKRFVSYAVLPGSFVLLTWTLAVAVFSPHTVSLAQNVSWIPKPTLAMFVHSLGHLLGGKAAALVLQLPIAVALWSRRKRGSNDFDLLLLLGSITMIVGMFAISRLLKPVWQDRYLIAAVVPYYLLVGTAVQSLSRRAVRGWTLAIAACAMVGLEYDLTHAPDRPVFGSFIAATAAVQHDIPILASDDLVGAPLEFGSTTAKHSAKVPVLEGVSRSENGTVQFELRDVFYSQGELYYARFDPKAANHTTREVPKDFVYAFDAESAALIEPGETPSQLEQFGCSLQDLAATRGEGHMFTLYRVHC